MKYNNLFKYLKPNNFDQFYENQLKSNDTNTKKNHNNVQLASSIFIVIKDCRIQEDIIFSIFPFSVDVICIKNK